MKIGDLERIYGAAGRELRALLLSVDLEGFDMAKAEALKRKARAIVDYLAGVSVKWARQTSADEYAKAAQKAKAILVRLGKKRPAGPDPARPGSERVAEVTETALLRATGSIMRTVELYAAAVTQAARAAKTLPVTVQEFAYEHLEDEIESLARQAVKQELSRGAFQQQVLAKLREEIGNQSFIIINDRVYDLIKYARMVARTELREAQTAATIDLCRKYENDLVEISSHGTTCEICMEFEGQVYSISGTHPKYPPLSESPPYHPNSYSKDTEIYTDAGWKPVNELNIGNRCLSLNPASLDLEYLPVIGNVSHYQDKMIHFCDHDFDLLVTPDHDMFYLSDWKYKYRKIGFEFRKAKDLLATKSGAFYRSSRWTGGGPLFVDGLSLEDFCIFMGYYLSEGCRAGNTGVHIAQAPGRKKDKMRTDLERMPLLTNEVQAGFRIRANRRLNQYLAPFGKSYEKYVPDVIKNAPPQYIRFFLDAFRLGDGSTRPSKPYKGGNFLDERLYFTSSKRMADDIGELLLKVGKRPSFGLLKATGRAVVHRNGTYTGNYDIWVIRECTSQFATLLKIKKSIEPYKDRAYCVELPTYHTLWVRRNGKTAWCGNCLHSILPTSDEEIYVREREAERRSVA